MYTRWVERKGYQLELIDLQPIKEAGLKVMVDVMWGNGAGYFTHLLRGAYGKREITNVDTDYTLQNFQYTGLVAMPARRLQFKYNFYAGRVEDSATRLQTDNFRNNFDLTLFYPKGAVYGGYHYAVDAVAGALLALLLGVYGARSTEMLLARGGYTGSSCTT